MIVLLEGQQKSIILRINKRKKYHFQEIYGNVSFYSNYWWNLEKSNEEKKKEISNVFSD